MPGAATRASSTGARGSRRRSTGPPEHGSELNELEREFLDDSRAEAEQEAEHQRRTNRRLRALLAGLTVLLALALVAGVVALKQRGEARDAARVADAQRLASSPSTRSVWIGRRSYTAPRSSSTSLRRRAATCSPSSCAPRRRWASSTTAGHVRRRHQPGRQAHGHRRRARRRHRLRRGHPAPAWPAVPHPGRSHPERSLLAGRSHLRDQLHGPGGSRLRSAVFDLIDPRTLTPAARSVASAPCGGRFRPCRRCLPADGRDLLVRPVHGAAPDVRQRPCTGSTRGLARSPSGSARQPRANFYASETADRGGCSSRAAGQQDVGARLRRAARRALLARRRRRRGGQSGRPGFRARDPWQAGYAARSGFRRVRPLRGGHEAPSFGCGSPRRPDARDLGRGRTAARVGRRARRASCSASPATVARSTGST